MPAIREGPAEICKIQLTESPQKAHRSDQEMKVAIAAKGKTLCSHVDDRFGRCSFFIVVNPESTGFDAIENPGLKERDAAGIEATRVLISKGVDAVLLRNIGHNVLVTLDGAGIEVYIGGAGRVLNAIEKLKKGEVTSAERPTVGFQDGLNPAD